LEQLIFGLERIPSSVFEKKLELFGFDVDIGSHLELFGFQLAHDMVLSIYSFAFSC